MDCPDERTWKGTRRTRGYGLPPIHLPHRLRPTLPRTCDTIEIPNPQGRKGNPRDGVTTDKSHSKPIGKTMRLTEEQVDG